SNWYVRRNRRRFWKAVSGDDKQAAYATLYECLETLTRLLAPFVPFITEAMYQNLAPAGDPAAAASVHLTDYPVQDEAKIDAALSADMAAVLDVVSAGHAARQEAAVKVRQPLPKILVHARRPETFEAVLRLQDQVLDELNVKAIERLTDPGDVFAYDIRPNLRLLGPKFGKRLGAVREALAKLAPADVAASVAAGQPVALDVTGGERIDLEPSEILVDLSKRAGYAAAQSAETTVALDTTLTPELMREGIARDFVRGVQDARKRAGYRIDDTIAVAAAADPEVAAAIETFRETIAAEILAVDLTVAVASGMSDAVEPELVAGPGGAGIDGHYVDQIVAGDHHVRIVLERRAR
ncbi:MAG TPA: DUF5915 domain-containing protein, partial [Thermomicrobiales bacterium]|nr:DUF5915 domain-containing protein [Thermomicrobiales bacterium]